MLNRELTITLIRRAYIYTIPPESAQRDCSGTVTAVEYCYRATRRDLEWQEKNDVFYILSLTPSVNQTDSRTQFTVNRRIRINSTASGNICTVSRFWYVCCENKSLEYQLQIPSSNFTFGIVTKKDFRLLISTNTTTEYINQKFFSNESILDTSTQEGSTFRSNLPLNQSSLLLRFHIQLRYVIR